jgi:hypothetical protein
MATVAAPVSVLLSAAHAPALGQLTVVTIAAAAAYLGALRVMFPGTWRDLLTMLTRIVPFAKLPRMRRRALVEARSAG